MDRPEAKKKMRHVYEPRKLPEVLSAEEVTRLLQFADNGQFRSIEIKGADVRVNAAAQLPSPALRLATNLTEGKVRQTCTTLDKGKGRRSVAPALLDHLTLSSNVSPF